MNESNQPQLQEELQPLTSETVQFSDGRVGLYFRTPNQRFNWDEHKYSRHLLERGSADLAILTTDTGRFAIGNGAIIKTDDSSPTTEGGYRPLEPGKRPAILLTELVGSNSLPAVILGKPWEILPSEGNLREIFLDYKDAPNDPGAHQIDSVNPFDRYRQILRDFSATHLS